MSEMQILEVAIKNWIEKAKKLGLLTEQGFRAEKLESPEPKLESLIYPQSLHEQDGAVFALLKTDSGRVLGIFGPEAATAGFEGTRSGGTFFAPLQHANAEILRRRLSYTAPSPLMNELVTFGLGDRLGAAGPGHIRTIRKYAAAPVLAQQSVRELDLTGRTYEDVLDAATWSVFQEGYRRPWGADGDHLKTEEWVKKALAIGYTMITADVSDYIKGEYAIKPEAEIMKDYASLPEDYRRRIEKEYLSEKIQMDRIEAITFNREEIARCALIYRESIEHACRLYAAGVEVRGEGGFDFELSVDETSTPTTPQAHAFIALEMWKARVPITSLAPRFVGEFQKGIDYIGDPIAFERSFSTHAALARKFGYRISVHSGSDKFSVFPVVGKCSEYRFHIKTAGTNWLEAMKIIARLEPALYRRMHRRALERFEKATRYYHVTTDLGKIPELDRLEDRELPELFENPDNRQLIHITYGELLSESSLKEDFFQALEVHVEEYWQALESHIGRHLDRLGVPKRDA